MKNLVKHLGIIAFIAIIGFSMTACDDGSGGGGGGGGNDPLNGTWGSESGDKIVLSNGAFTASEGNVECFKGTYSASGSNISMTITQFVGAYIIREARLEDMGLSETQWYTQSALRTAIINYFVGLGASQSEAEAAYNEYVAPSMPGMYQTATGTLSGTTLNIFGDTFTKQGGTTPGTDPGGGGDPEDDSYYGTYRHPGHESSNPMCITLNNNGTFKGEWGSDVITGNYTVSGSTLTLDTKFPPDYDETTWEITNNMFMGWYLYSTNPTSYWTKLKYGIF